ncbi:hypothetical protein FNV43_RR04154 [Rhamnella rubrinervis]|uniref:Nuclear pore complex protein NUP1 n=1 Tax=Rhamnella rubrinervis TaxID=2594499 RepID=A0A8K0MPZ2_9ROSA|nr:hypothetical protein FNV43_RR04154 [Rhamnella rubrinervis]
MEGEAHTAPSTGPYGGGESGAGGKLRKPSTRKPPTTPYSRPAASLAERGQRRWLSKLVDPACRLITGGATRLFPSFFSKSSPSISALPETNVEDHDKWDTKVEPNANGGDQACTLNHEVPRTPGEAGPSKAAGRSESGSDFNLDKQDTHGDLPDEIGLSEIEQLLKGKNFTRVEINRLMEIIKSRAVELPNLEREEKAGGAEAEGPLATHQIPKMSFEKNHEDKPGLWGISTPLPQSVMADKVGASPVEIARAYMGSRTSEVDISSKRMMSKDERSFLHGGEFAKHPFTPSPSPKPSACWPGAMLQDYHGYSTPQSQKGILERRHNFPRTPYSRSIFSKSKSKLSQLKADDDKLPIPSSTSLQQSQTPIFGQVKSRNDALDYNYGSVRRSRHKIAAQTPPRGSVFGNSSVGPSKVEKTNVSEGFLPAANKNFEPGETSSNSQFQSVERKRHSFEVGTPTVHPQSSQIARTILEHIDRNPPTPKEKAEELKLAISWKKTPSLGVPSIIPNGHKSLLPVKEFDSRKIMNLDDPKASAQENADKCSSLQENNPKANDTVSRVPGSDVYVSSGGEGGTEVHSLQKDVTKIASSLLPNLQKKPPSVSSSVKPFLSNIFIDKPDLRWKCSSENSSGFTFPVSTSSGVVSEPPTPSVLPTFSGSSEQYPPKDGHSELSYTFGASKSNPALVFSFPSTSSAASRNDASDIKYSFGSDKPRLSFGSVGKNTICY